MRRRNGKMNLPTPDEMIELGRVLMIWGGSIFLIGAVLSILGFMYRDILFSVVNEIIERI